MPRTPPRRSPPIWPDASRDRAITDAWTAYSGEPKVHAGVAGCILGCMSDPEPLYLDLL